MKLDDEEKALLESFENDEWTSLDDVKSEAKRLDRAARATFRKDKRVNIRISERDLMDLKKRAVEDGLPYQTLISSVLHKFVSGSLVDRSPSS